jgi:kynureninase
MEDNPAGIEDKWKRPRVLRLLPTWPALKNSRMQNTAFSRAHCQGLDQPDPMAHFREKFDLPEDVTFLDGNSQGPGAPSFLYVADFRPKSLLPECYFEL